MRWKWSLLIIGFYVACSIPSDQPAEKEATSPAPVVKPPDETRRFPLKDRTTIELVDNHIMGKDFLVGGNVAEYSRGGTTYRMFLTQAKNSQAAALLLYDYQTILSDAKYVAHMGGFFGKDGDEDVFVFPKDKWLAGVVGLPEKEADLVARDFAARLY